MIEAERKAKEAREQGRREGLEQAAQIAEATAFADISREALGPIYKDRELLIAAIRAAKEAK